MADCLRKSNVDTSILKKATLSTESETDDNSDDDDVVIHELDGTCSDSEHEQSNIMSQISTESVVVTRGGRMAGSWLNAFNNTHDTLKLMATMSPFCK